MISGVGFAIAKTIGSAAMVLIISGVSIGSGNAEEHVRALQCVSQSSSLMLPVGELSHFSLGGI